MADPSGWRPIVVVLVVASAGCLGVLTGEEPARFEASAAAIDAAEVAESGYVESRIEPQVITRPVSVAGQSREVEVTNRIAEYERSVEIAGTSGEFARLTVLSTPKIEVLGRTFNPVADRSNREIAEGIQDQHGSVSDLRVAGERSIVILGRDTTVTRFEGSATPAGGLTVDVTVHLATLEHGDDYVIAVAVHPTVLPGERDRVDRLLRGIVHPA